MSQAKRYLLLRNNIKSGPYTYNEIRKQSIRPSDLIWIEGESTSWKQPRFGATNRLHAKDGRSAPANQPLTPVHKDEQQMYQEPVSYTTAGNLARFPFDGPAEPGDRAFLQRDRTSDEQPKIKLVRHSSDRHTVSLSQLLFITALAAASILVWNNRFNFMPDANDNVTYAIPTQVFEATPPVADRETASLQPAADSIPPSARNEVTVATIPERKETKRTVSRSATKKIATGRKKDTNLLTLPIVEEKSDPVPVETVAAEPPPSPASVAPETGEKKKGLGQAIKNIFKKKKKKDVPLPDEQ